MGKFVRARAIITGRVQGVFFRAETRRAAIDRNVNGWVRNRPDGSVEAVIEGEEASVTSMLEWCWKGSPLSKVQHVDIRREPYEGEFNRFEIVY